jgi:hypothetical protein
MMARLADFYLLALVIAGVWMLSVEPYMLDGAGNRMVGFVVLLAAAGWYATLGGAHRLVKIGVRVVSVVGATAIIATMAVSFAAAG